MAFDEKVIFGDGRDKQIARIVGEYMTDRHWVENAIERMQESLIDDNKDIVRLIAKSVELYQEMPPDEAKILHFLQSVKPFWNAIMAHAHKEAVHDVEGDMDDIYNDD